MCGAFYPNYFLKGEIDEEDAVRMMSGHDPLETVMVMLTSQYHSKTEITPILQTYFENIKDLILSQKLQKKDLVLEEPLLIRKYS